MTLSSSRVFRQCGASFLIGIIFSHYFPFHISFSFLSTFIFLLICFWFCYKRRSAFLFFILLSFFIGQSHYIYSFDQLNKTAIKEEQKIEVEASIITEPILKDNYQRIIIPNTVIYTDRYPLYHYGDLIRIKGKVQPFENFRSYSSIIISGKISYPKIEFISSGRFSLKKIALSFKNKITGALQKIISEPQVSLLNSIIFGGKNNLSISLEKEIQKAGLSHIVVASGLHLSIITKMFSSLLALFCLGNLLNFVFLCLFLLGFAFMAGLTSSIIRAAIMSFLLVLAHFSYRLYNPLNALLLACLIMVWFNPFLLFWDLGFQLSFLSTAGILFFYSRWEQSSFWQHSFFNLKGMIIIKQTVLACFSALVLVVPWLIFKTQNFSLVAPFTNILIIPLVPLIIGGGALTAIVSFLFYPFGLFCSIFLDFILSYALKVISFFSSLSWAEIYIPDIFRWVIIPYYIFIFIYLRKNKI
ncbi:MAG: ComEC/Rec2 family competence protein [Candidatus Pacebacteria bacterium]|jgi:competence protein ComEC|nr:ComEC/Rec2 family competence protein [Candidatus Paceibacterota bacterium]MDD4994374.1 ComEC/Rec2 family competence protein [Candidatus Paceibacterota bacterium]MDD5535079.1 ComEC/Rec2 family competence protein [Candidatus Paceibacterota bacterium]